MTNYSDSQVVEAARKSKCSRATMYRRLKRFDTLEDATFIKQRGARCTREGQTWYDMIQRCTNPVNKSWANYGGRGISVCERWMKFDNFLEDMGPKPMPSLSIDRIDNDGDYEPGNCRWADSVIQNNNKDRAKPRRDLINDLYRFGFEILKWE